MQLNAIPIEPRLAMNHGNVAAVLNPAEPLQRFFEDQDLLLKLKLIAGVLILASAASKEVLAARGYAFGRGFDNSGARRAQKSVFNAPRRNANALARKRKWDQNDLSVDAREAIAAINQLLYFNVYRTG